MSDFLPVLVNASGFILNPPHSDICSCSVSGCTQVDDAPESTTAVWTLRLTTMSRRLPMSGYMWLSLVTSSQQSTGGVGGGVGAARSVGLLLVRRLAAARRAGLRLRWFRGSTLEVGDCGNDIEFMH